MFSHHICRRLLCVMTPRHPVTSTLPVPKPTSGVTHAPTGCRCSALLGTISQRASLRRGPCRGPGETEKKQSFPAASNVPFNCDDNLVLMVFGISASRYKVAITKHKDLEQTSSSLYSQNNIWTPAVDFSKYIADNESIVEQVC